MRDGLLADPSSNHIEALQGANLPDLAGTMPSTDTTFSPDVVTNSIGMELVTIQSGEFQMGGSNTDRSAISDEHPNHPVRISRDFLMGVYEVTNAEYSQVTGFGESDQLPVRNVSWDDAVDFCRRLSEMPDERSAGRSYRLPTEAEWEYACRAGSTTRYYWGDDASSWREYVNSGAPIEVGRLKPNAWGLYDMQGNQTEWCADWYAEDYYRGSSEVDPKGPATGTLRVHRGASTATTMATDARSAARWKFDPATRYATLGFRVVCEIR
jgi:formylglycine-generating enzyme required for sulfatase activity